MRLLNPRQVQYLVTRQALSRFHGSCQVTIRERSRLTGTATKLGSMVSPASYLTDSPDVNWGKIYRFRYQYSPSACNLSVERDVVPGWRGIVSDRVSLSPDPPMG